MPITAATPAGSAAATPRTPPGGGAPHALTVLVVDDSSACRRQSSQALAARGFATMEADDGTSALALVDQRQIDLIVLDNEMPHMSGLTFLKTLRANKAWARTPVIMLTSTPSREVAAEVMKYGVRGYLLKSKSSMLELVTRAVALLGTPGPGNAVAGKPPKSPGDVRPNSPGLNVKAGTSAGGAPKTADQPKKEQPVAGATAIAAPNLVLREATLAAVAGMPTAKTLAGVIADVIEKASSPHTSMSQIAATIRQDPVFCARVMQLAGSGAYAGAKPRTASLDDAVRSIGAVAICELASSVGVFDNFPAGNADGLDLLRCWQHAIGVAAVMGRIVPRGDSIPAGVPHLIGLCHDLPEILLRQRFPQEFSAAVDFAQQAKVPVSQLLPAVFGVPMGEFSEAMLAKMKLPAVIADSIREFSRTALMAPEAYPGLVLRALAISNYFAHALLLTSSADEVVAPVTLNECRSVLLTTARFNWAEIRSEAITTTSMLSKLKPEAEAAASAPLINRSEKKVGYIRHGSFADLDPLEAALCNLCDVVVQPHPPRAANLENLDGIIVTAPGSDTVLASEVIRLRAQCGAQVPILYVAGPASQHSLGSISAFEEVQYPVSLNRLAGFIAALKE